MPRCWANRADVRRAASPRDLTPGDYDAPPFSLGGQDNYAFSPDGQEICYTSNHDKVEATSTNNDLWIVPVNGGAGQEHYRRQSRERLDAALFARWKVHRLPRPAASGIRERPVPADAVRPEDGGEEESDRELRSLGRDIRLGAMIRRYLLRRRRQGRRRRFMRSLDASGMRPISRFRRVDREGLQRRSCCDRMTERHCVHPHVDRSS